MSKKEVTNTFSEGIINDLNPINVPSNALTDCLNGTLITYDGNEFSLQNDKGNFPLENCKLKKNYIPVGMKEYGDIVYIVSYNPLDRHTEIGSYPSPQKIFTEPNKKDFNHRFKSVYDKCNWSRNIEDIRKEEEIYIFTSSNQEDIKINPGDQYKFTITGTLNDFEYIDYYLLSDKKNLNLITDFDFNKSNDFAYTSLCGYFGAKLRFAEIDECKIYIHKAVYNHVDGIIKELSFAFQIQISDKKLIEDINKLKYNIGFKIEYGFGENKEATKYFEPTTEFKRINIGNGNVILYWNNEYFSPFSNDVKIENNNYAFWITAEPYIILDTGCKIIFNTVQDKSSIDFNESVDINDIKIGKDTWKYYVSDDLLSLTFDTSGFNHGLLFNESEDDSISDLSLFITLKDYITNSEEPVLGPKDITEFWILDGNSTIDLDFDSSFKKENIYLAKIELKSGNKLLKNIERVIVASELMNPFFVNENSFENIHFNKWLGNYKDTIKNKEIFSTIEAEDIVGEDVSIDGSSLYNTWKNNLFIGSRELGNKEYADVTFRKKAKLKTTRNSKLKLLNGPLWDNLLSKASLNINSDLFGSEEYGFNTDGSVKGLDNSNIDIDSDIKFNKQYKLNSECNNMFYFKYRDEKLNVGKGVIRLVDFGVGSDKNQEPKSKYGIAFNVYFEKGVNNINYTGDGPLITYNERLSKKYKTSYTDLNGVKYLSEDENKTLYSLKVDRKEPNDFINRVVRSVNNMDVILFNIELITGTVGDDSAIDEWDKAYLQKLSRIYNEDFDNSYITINKNSEPNVAVGKMFIAIAKTQPGSTNKIFYFKEWDAGYDPFENSVEMYHRVADTGDKSWGNFYTLKGEETDIDFISDIMHSKINFNSFKIGDIDLLNFNDRNTLSTKYEGVNGNNFICDDNVNLNSFDPISFNDIKTTVAIPEIIESSVKSKIQELDTEILNHNTEIINERASWIEFVKEHPIRDNENISVYYIGPNTSEDGKSLVRGIISDLNSGDIESDHKGNIDTLVFRVKDTHKGDTYQEVLYLGKILD